LYGGEPVDIIKKLGFQVVSTRVNRRTDPQGVVANPQARPISGAR
jgi:hypothetical protein